MAHRVNLSHCHTYTVSIPLQRPPPLASIFISRRTHKAMYINDNLGPFSDNIFAYRKYKLLI
jgi:hypothetical protein